MIKINAEIIVKKAVVNFETCSLTVTGELSTPHNPAVKVPVELSRKYYPSEVFYSELAGGAPNPMHSLYLLLQHDLGAGLEKMETNNGKRD